MNVVSVTARRRAARDLAGLSFEQQALEREIRYEHELDALIVRYCRGLASAGFRLLTYHTHDSRRSAAGYPDRVILVPGWCWLLELKVWPNAATPAQRDWLALYATVPGVTASLVYPRDWPAIAADVLERLEARCRRS